MSQLTIVDFSRKIDYQIQHLGRAFKHNLVPWEGYLNKPVLKSSLAHGLPRGDIKSLNWPMHKILTVGAWHSHEHACGPQAINWQQDFLSLMSYHQRKCAEKPLATSRGSANKKVNVYVFQTIISSMISFLSINCFYLLFQMEYNDCYLKVIQCALRDCHLFVILFESCPDHLQFWHIFFYVTVGIFWIAFLGSKW